MVLSFLHFGNALAVEPFHSRIDSISRPSGPPDTVVELRGSFGQQKVPNRGLKVVQLFSGSQRVGSFSIVSWSPNNVQAKVPYGVPKGRYDMKICDGLNACSNSVGFIVRKAPRPELKVSSEGMTIGFQKRKVACGDRITLTRPEVRWLPDGRVDFDITYRYEEYNDVYANGFKNTISWNERNYAGRTPVTLVEHTNQQIVGKDKKSVTTHATIGRPEYGILILELNKDELVKETGRWSNRCTAALYFSGFGQDLIVSNIKLKTKKPKVNKPITFDITVKNVGKEKAEASKTGIQFGGSSKIIEFPVPELEPQKSFTRRISLPGVGKAQKYRITVTADYQNRIREMDESKNRKYKTITVKK
jgi:hypothetical protein